MKHLNDDAMNPHEHDALWKLLERATEYHASPEFADDVVRRSRLTSAERLAWWDRWFSPAPVFAAAAAAVCVGVGLWLGLPAPEPSSAPLAKDSFSRDGGFAHLQEVLEIEMFFAVIDRLDECSDEDLVALIGF